MAAGIEQGVIERSAWVAATTNEGERSEAERGGAKDHAGRGPSPPAHDTEVAVRARRRTFTAEYKLRILRQAEVCKKAGELGALLRREGLYSSHLVSWRRDRDRGALKTLAPRKRGPQGSVA